jgi:hypothetical protein
MNKGFIIHPEVMDELLSMKPEECGQIIHNMIRTFWGEETKKFDDRYMDFVSSTLCGRVDRELKLYEKKSKAGQMGGAPIGNSNATKQTKNKQKTSKKQAKDKQKTSPIPYTLYPIPDKPIKDIYGEAHNVYLTKEEYEKVQAKGLTNLIDELSLYMASKNKTYADHYMTILAWGRRREKEKPVMKTNQFNDGISKATYDLSALEKKLIKN